MKRIVLFAALLISGCDLPPPKPPQSVAEAQAAQLELNNKKEEFSRRALRFRGKDNLGSNVSFHCDRGNGIYDGFEWMYVIDGAKECSPEYRYVESKSSGDWFRLDRRSPLMTCHNGRAIFDGLKEGAVSTAVPECKYTAFE